MENARDHYKEPRKSGFFCCLNAKIDALVNSGYDFQVLSTALMKGEDNYAQ
jgi:hypothetical protein